MMPKAHHGLAEDPLALAITATVALAFSAIHFFAPNLRRLFELGGSRLASISGGMAVAFAIIILLPEIYIVSHSIGSIVYPLILAGLVGFYVIELVLLRRKAVLECHAGRHIPDHAGASVHFVISWLYTFGLVYALPDEVHGHVALVFLTSVVIGIHLAYKDSLLAAHHPSSYRQYGCYILATSPLVALLAGLMTEPSELVSNMILGLISGYLLQNVFRNEMPEQHDASPLAFAGGAMVVGVPLTMVQYLT